MDQPSSFSSNTAAFLAGVRTPFTSVLFYVLCGNYIGIGALAQEFGFSFFWFSISTVLVWAAPGQVILVSALGTGASLLEAALAVGLSGIRFVFMTVALLPLLRTPTTPWPNLVLPAHFVAVTQWVESLRLLPSITQDRRIAFCNGISIGFVIAALIGGFLGFFLASRLPVALAAGLLFLTPISFLISIARNSRIFVERAAFVIGLIVAPLLAYFNVGLDLLWTGLIGGTLAFAMRRLFEARS